MELGLGSDRAAGWRRREGPAGFGERPNWTSRGQRRTDSAAMAESDPRAGITARVVTSLEEAMARRQLAPRGPGRSGGSPADQLLHAMHTVKAARFNAAERFERKHIVSVFALSMVSLYFVGLSVWQVGLCGQSQRAR